MPLKRAPTSLQHYYTRRSISHPQRPSKPSSCAASIQPHNSPSPSPHPKARVSHPHHSSHNSNKTQENGQQSTSSAPIARSSDFEGCGISVLIPATRTARTERSQHHYLDLRNQKRRRNMIIVPVPGGQWEMKTHPLHLPLNRRVYCPQAGRCITLLCHQ